MNYIKGLDVSSVQGNIDFNAVAAQGIKFCIIKGAEGNKGIDPNLAKNLAGCKAAGILTGVYSFLYPLPTIPSQPTRDPKWQAQKHQSVANGELGFIDLEWAAPQDWAKWGQSANQICDWTLTYLEEYTRLDGRKPVLYSYPYFINAIKPSSDFAQYPLWIASYEATPAIPHPWTDWVMWQNTGGGGHLPNGAPVDTDLVQNLSLWGVSDTVPAAPSVPEVNTAPQTPVSAPDPTQPIHPTDPTPQPDAVAPSPARPDHPTAPISGLQSVLNMLITLLKGLLHI